VAAATGAALVLAGGFMTVRALEETTYLRDVTLADIYTCTPTCGNVVDSTPVDASRRVWSDRMRISDIANGLGFAALGTGLWLGLSGDRPAPGEPRRFLKLSQRTWGYVLAGAGVVVGGGGVLFHQKMNDLRGEAEDLMMPFSYPNWTYPNPSNAYARNRAADEFQGLRNRFFLMGGGLVAAGAVLWFTGGVSAPAVSVDFMPTPGGGMAFLSGSY
jgi:hypothetical protein